MPPREPKWAGDGQPQLQPQPLLSVACTTTTGISEQEPWTCIGGSWPLQHEKASSLPWGRESAGDEDKIESPFSFTLKEQTYNSSSSPGAVVPATNIVKLHPQLLYVRCDASTDQFLVDCGSAITLLRQICPFPDTRPVKRSVILRKAKD